MGEIDRSREGGMKGERERERKREREIVCTDNRWFVTNLGVLQLCSIDLIGPSEIKKWIYYL